MEFTVKELKEIFSAKEMEEIIADRKAMIKQRKSLIEQYKTEITTLNRLNKTMAEALSEKKGE